MIGDCDAMGVSAEVAKHLLGSAEGRFAIYHPAQGEQLMDEALKESGLRQVPEQAMEPQLSGSVSLLETFDELAAKDFAEYVFWKEEVRMSGAHPMRVVAGETAGGHDTMNMRMVLQLLIPGMEDAKETDLGAQVSGIGRDLDQRLGARTKQQAVDHFFVL